MSAITMQDVIVSSLRRQAGRPNTDVDPLVDGKIFLTGKFDINAIVADIEKWALGGNIGREEIQKMVAAYNKIS